MKNEVAIILVLSIVVFGSGYLIGRGQGREAADPIIQELEASIAESEKRFDSIKEINRGIKRGIDQAGNSIEDAIRIVEFIELELARIGALCR